MKNFAIVILVLTAAASAFGQTRTVTNADLEKYRRQRVENERKLKERYAEMGFPSPAEIERRNDERRAAMEEYSDELRERRLMSQNEIIAEANALRAEIASIDAQINYLRGQTGGGSRYKGGTVVISGYLPYGGYGGYRGYGGGLRGKRNPLGQISRLPQEMRMVQEYAAMYPNAQSLNAQASGNVRIGGGRRNYYRGGYVEPVIVGDAYDTSPTAEQLIYLEQTRAGLLAEWRIIEEKARRAGIRLD
jgi:hypothetical protein